MDATWFERSALYQDVWQTPMTTLAKRHGFSDNGLRKICIKLAVPMPPAGYWARVAAGYQGTRPPLPQTDGPVVYERPTSRRQPAPIPDDADTQWLRRSLVFEQDPANRVPVELNPRRWHPAIAPIQSWLGECVATLKRDRDEAKVREERRKRRQQSDVWEVNRSALAMGNNYPILGLSFRRSAVRVSDGTGHRALAILNALAMAATARGYDVSIQGNFDRISFAIRGETVTATLAERIESRALPPSNEFGQVHRDQFPTGRLQVNLERHTGSIVSVSDTSETALEYALNAVLCRMHRQIERGASMRRRRDQDLQERATRGAALAAAEAERRCREAELATQRRLDAAILERNQAMSHRLVMQADRRQQAQNLREYIRIVVHVAGAEDFGVSRKVLREWVCWANSAADELDPIRGQLGELRAASAQPDSRDDADGAAFNG